MTLARLSPEDMARSLRIPGATQWGKGESADAPGTHPMNASARLYQREIRLWAGTNPVRITPGSSVFAIGSCFAREIERVLDLKGFDIGSYVPGNADDVIKEVALTNRYNTASMLLELRRLLEGPGILPDNALFIEQPSGQFIDSHYHSSVNGMMPEMLARRARFQHHFQSIRNADVLFFTLGLNEAAYDPRVGLYRNVSPTVREIRSGLPVEVHTFTTAENLHLLNAIHALIRAHCPKNPRIFVTVSPVPLTLTYQEKDVIVANAEGKAILRAAAAEFCASHPDVTYFHSYEMAMSAAPGAVFTGDRRHVKKRFVATIVAEFLRRHCPDLAAAEADADTEPN